jgi:hypothetical protein
MADIGERPHPTGGVSNELMDSCAQAISLEVAPEDIKSMLVGKGLDDYQAYLCYQAAKLLLRTGFYQGPQRHATTKLRAVRAPQEPDHAPG